MNRQFSASMMPDPGTVIEALRVLTTPDQSTTVSGSLGGSDSTRFDTLLSDNVKRLEEKLKSDPKLATLQDVWSNPGESTHHLREATLDPGSSRWLFVRRCLKLLHILQKSIQDALKRDAKKVQRKLSDFSEKESAHIQPPTPSPDTLSFGEQKVVLTAVQFVVCLGLCPYLQTGVGIPVERRSEFGKLVLSSEISVNLNTLEKQWCLYVCVRTLVDCVFTPSLGTLILSRHFSDVLAGLFQLLHIQESRSLANKGQGQHEMSLAGEIDNASFCISVCNIDSSNQPLVRGEESLTLSPASVVDIVRQQIQKAENQAKQQSAETALADDTITASAENIDSEQSSDNIDKTCQQQSLTPESSNTDQQDLVPDFQFCEKALQDLVKKVYPPLLVKTLLLLQGGPPQKKKPVSGMAESTGPVLAPAPVWLRRRCGKHLTDIIMGPKGVVSVLRGMLEGPGGGNQSTAVQASDWRKCDAVAKVIACCPMQSLSVEEYYKLVAPQVLEILHIQDKQVARMYQRVATSTISNMAAKFPNLTMTYIIQPLLQPLLSVTSDADIALASSPCVLVSEQQLSNCIEDIHKVFVSRVCNNQTLMDSLRPVMHCIYSLLIFCKQGVSGLRTACHEILVTYLKSTNSEDTLICLKLLAFEQTDKAGNSGFRKMHPDAVFSPGSGGGVVIVTGSVANNTEQILDDVCVNCMVELLKDLQKDGSAAEFLLYMMKELTSFVSMEIKGGEEEKKEKQSSTDTQPLLEIETENQSHEEQFIRKLKLLNLLAAVCENLGPDCFRNNLQTLDFVKVTLERAVQVCRATDDMVTEMFESETLTMAMGLITASLTGGLQMKDEEREYMKQFLPLLEEISVNHPAATVQEMASDLRIAIATHGVVLSEIMKNAAGEFKDKAKNMKQQRSNARRTKNAERTEKPKIEVLGEIINQKSGQKAEIKKPLKSENVGIEKMELTSEKQLPNENVNVSEIIGERLPGQHTGLASESSPEMDQAFKELLDPLIPVRGHGLIRLTKLIQIRDPEVLKKSDVCFKIFEENLQHDDSYLYLSAINGLAALCDIQPQIVLPKLCAVFVAFQQLKKKSVNPSAKLKMKIGEVLVKATRNLGDLVPKYRELLLNTVLTGTKDQDATVRASSLSNLGEICKLLHFSLGNVLQEVFLCCSSLLKSDLDPEVRKAAAVALTLLLQGLGGDTLKILDSVLGDLYRLLKFVVTTEKDEQVKVHATLALNELDDIIRGQLFPEVKLEKRIRVLDPE